MAVNPEAAANEVPGQAPVDLQSPEPFNHGVMRPSWVPAEATWAQEVAAEYGISKPQEVWRLNRPEANSTAFLLLAGSDSYVLRFWRGGDAARLTLLEVSRNFAVDHGLPGPRSLCTESGRLFWVRDDRLATLTPFVEGEYFRGDVASLESAAVLQAAFHETMRPFPLAMSLGSSPHSEMDVEENIPWEKVQSGNEPFDALARLTLEESRAWPDAVPDFSLLPRQCGHFDWNPQNLLFRSGGPEVEALLDYDFAGLAERALDVALGMHKFARVFGEKTEAREDMGSDLRARCLRYLRAYHARSPLSPEEVAAIPCLLFLQARRNIRFIVTKHFRDLDGTSDYDLAKQRVLLREALALRGLG